MSCAAANTRQRVSEDVASADESGVSGTPTFFINGRRHYGVYDIDTLTEAVGRREAQSAAAFVHRRAAARGNPQLIPAPGRTPAPRI